MINEEFQGLVLKKLKSLEDGQKEIKEDLKSVSDQTVNLTDFSEVLKGELAIIKSTMSRIEIAFIS